MFSFVKEGFKKLKNSLLKTRNSFLQSLTSLFQKPWSEESIEELERILYEADMGTVCTQEAISYLKKHIRHDNPSLEEVQEALKNYALSLLKSPPPFSPSPSPHVILIVGINGSGKTTTCAKLANKFKKSGKKVLLAAADTFRAAASEQLILLAKKIGVDSVSSQSGSDPSSVAFDALKASISRGIDIAIIDTAGRLQSKADLMQELGKIKKVMGKVIENAPHNTYLILDATSGQNALDQAKTFHACTPLSGIILTKIDGSAKGGILLPLTKELNIPILYLGVGEKEEDLIEFSPEDYAEALFKG